MNKKDETVMNQGRSDMNELINFPVDYDEKNAVLRDGNEVRIMSFPSHSMGSDDAKLWADGIGGLIAEALNAYHDNRWRDVKDEPPKISAAYFISIADSDFVQSAWYIARKQIFVKLDGSEAFTGVTAWMPQMLRYQPAELEVSE